MFGSINELKRLIELNIVLSRLNLKRNHSIMATLADIQAKAAQIIAGVTANTNALSAIAAVIDADHAQITELKAELDAALANGDPAAIQAASDALDQGISALSGQAAAEAALAGTPAAPAPAPAPGDPTAAPSA